MTGIERDDFDAALVDGFRGSVSPIYAREGSIHDARRALMAQQGIRLERRGCPLCHRAGWDRRRDSLVHAYPDFAVVRCGDCGFIFNDAIVRPADNRKFNQRNNLSANRVDLHEHDLYARLKKTKCAYILQRLRSVVPLASVLDVGCGFGDLIVAARQSGIDATGVELDQTALALARRRGLNVIEAELPEEAGRLPRNLDAIVALDILEHVADPVGFLAALKDALAPRGCIALQVPNFESLIVQLEGPSNHNFCIDHCSTFDRASIERVVRLAGYDVLALETYISELDLIRRYPQARIRDTVARLRDAVDAPEPLTTDWLHEAFLGYKLFCLATPARA